MATEPFICNRQAVTSGEKRQGNGCASAASTAIYLARCYVLPPLIVSYTSPGPGGVSTEWDSLAEADEVCGSGHSKCVT